MKTLDQLLEVDEAARLGSQGPDLIKSHSWFNGLDWKSIADGTCPVPDEITSHIDSYVENHAEDASIPIFSPSNDPSDLNSPQWLDDW